MQNFAQQALINIAYCILICLCCVMLCLCCI